jgi:molybdate transport system regulatory protein
MVPHDRAMARVKIKIQIMSGDDIAIGPGKAALLEAIAQTGSISAAARAMGMSYRRAWLLVDAMNRCFRKPLVETQPGGGRGAGARLTDAGSVVLDAYRAVVEAAEKGVTEALGLDRLLAALREVPSAS